VGGVHSTLTFISSYFLAGLFLCAEPGDGGGQDKAEAVVRESGADVLDDRRVILGRACADDISDRVVIGGLGAEEFRAAGRAVTGDEHVRVE
jgi:hypothetical protein